MQHEEHIVCKREHDALADPARGLNGLPGDGVDGRIDGAKNERTEEGETLETLSRYVSLERFEVNDNVRQFRQIESLIPNP